MKKITYRTDKDVLYIELEGRIDAQNSADIETDIDEIIKNNEGRQTVLDADKLSYISSAGLRIILRLRKKKEDLSIINVSPEVYNVFDMTGFTDMITIEKAYPEISIEGCEFIAKGANGAVYRYDNETIVKQYFNRDALDEIKQERENARKAFVLGVNTAIPYGIVRIGEGYGSVTELLNAVSLSKLIKNNKEDMSEAVAYFTDTIKNIHSIRVEEGVLPDYKKWVESWVEFASEYLSCEQAEKLKRLVSDLPESKCIIHGDYHTNNVLIQNGEALIIDLDTLACGCPVLELGSTFNAYVGFSELDKTSVQDFLGIDFETSERFWKEFLAAYLETKDEALIIDAENKAKVIGYMRLFRRSVRRNYDEKILNHYKERLIDAINKVETLVI